MLKYDEIKIKNTEMYKDKNTVCLCISMNVYTYIYIKNRYVIYN